MGCGSFASVGRCFTVWNRADPLSLLSELVSSSSDLNSGAVGKTACSVACRVVSRHGARWRALSSARKSVFGSKAATGTREKHREYAEKLSEAHLASSTVGSCSSVRLATASFSQAETAAFNAMWDSDQLCGKHLKAFVNARLKALGSPP